MSDHATRTVLVAILVLSAHAALVWLSYTGASTRPVQIVIPVDMPIEALMPPPVAPAPPPRAPTPSAGRARNVPPGPARPADRTQTAPPASVPVPQARAAPQRPPVATEPETHAPVAPTAPAAQDGATVAPLAAPPSAIAGSSGSNAAPTTTPAPPRIALPSSQAAHLHNPKPAYPPLSQRLGEQGRVVVRVRIEADGTASRAEIHASSGHDRLDQAARQTVLRWRYVPGQRDGVPEAMWFNVPIQFILE